MSEFTEFKGCYVVPLDHLSSLLVQGQDALSFLQGQLTCDLNTITATSFSWGAHCNTSAKVLSLFRLHVWQNAIMLTTETSCFNASLKELSRFILRSKVSLEPLNPTLHRIGLIGHEAPLLLKDLFGIAAIPPLTILQHGELTITRMPGPIPRYELLGPSEAHELLIQQRQHTSIPAQPSLWRYADLLSKMPWLTTKTRGLFFAHELGLYEQGAINLHKGCYIGQEIIARVYFKSKPKHHLMLLDLNTEPLHLDLEKCQILNANHMVVGQLVCHETYHNQKFCLAII